MLSLNQLINYEARVSNHHYKIYSRNGLQQVKLINKENDVKKAYDIAVDYMNQHQDNVVYIVNSNSETIWSNDGNTDINQIVVNDINFNTILKAEELLKDTPELKERVIDLLKENFAAVASVDSLNFMKEEKHGLELLIDKICRYVVMSDKSIYIIVGDNSSGKSVVAEELAKYDNIIVKDNFYYYRDDAIFENALDEIEDGKKLVLVTHDFAFCEHHLESVDSYHYDGDGDISYIVMFPPERNRVVDSFLPIEFPGWGGIDSVREAIDNGYNKDECEERLRSINFV